MQFATVAKMFWSTTTASRFMINTPALAAGPATVSVYLKKYPTQVASTYYGTEDVPGGLANLFHRLYGNSLFFCTTGKISFEVIAAAAPTVCPECLEPKEGFGSAQNVIEVIAKNW